MTGHGQANRQCSKIVIAIEVRTINNRFLKLSVRSSDGYSVLEPKIESIVRRHVRRGTVQVNLRVDREATQDDYQLNETVLTSYRSQLESIGARFQMDVPIHLESLLGLPGVVDEQLGRGVSAEDDWPLIESVVEEAMKSLSVMRTAEGSAMEEDLRTNCRIVADELEKIKTRTPLVTENYHNRLRDRLNKLLSQFDVQVESQEIVREVGLFAERSDISEEIVRLQSHLNQFDEIMGIKESNGRKLEFLTQEMYREINTIGSKANDAQIALNVIEIKAVIERMREMIQNVE